MDGQPRRIRVFIASPGDVPQERAAARRIVQRLARKPLIRRHADIQPLAWDDPLGGPLLEATLSPQSAISQGLARPSECDVVVAIFWSRFGTPLPHDQYKKRDGSPYLSGAEWEFEDAFWSHKECGRPRVLVYRCTRPVELKSTDEKFESLLEQCYRLWQFFKRFKDDDGAIIGGVNFYTEAKEFEKRLSRDLEYLIGELIMGGKPALAVPQNHNLPRRVFGHLIGRRPELERLLKALSLQFPLIAIEGFKGIGKTSVALELGYLCAQRQKLPAEGGQAEVEAPPFDFVVWASAKDKPEQKRWLDDVLNAVARVLGSPAVAQIPAEASARKREEVARLLRSRRALVIIDNFETIEDDELSEWCEEVPDPSKVLVTTQLSLASAYPVHLPGLKGPGGVALVRQEAEKLSLIAVRDLPDSELEQLLVATGGNPRAIELALGQVKGAAVSLAAVIQGLDDVGLSAGTDTIVDHLYANSWAGISNEGKEILVVVPLFRGTGSIGREALRAASGLTPDAFDTGLRELMDYKLLEHEPIKGRLLVYPMTRRFMMDRLGERGAGFERAARRRWCNYYLRFVRDSVLREKPEQPYWNALVTDRMKRVDPEWPAIKEVLTWAERERVREPWADEVLLDLVMLLVHYMDSRLLNRERTDHVERAMGAAERLGRRAEQAILAIDALGWTYVEERNPRAPAQIQAGLDLVRGAASATGGEAGSLRALARIWQARSTLEEKDLAAAAPLVAEAIDIDTPPVVRFRVCLVAGDLELARGNPAAALKYYQDAVSLSDSYGGEGGGYQTEGRLGLACLDLDRLEEAERHFTSLTRLEVNAIGQLWGRYGLAKLAHRRGQREQALALALSTRDELLRRAPSNLLLRSCDELLNKLRQEGRDSTAPG